MNDFLQDSIKHDTFKFMCVSVCHCGNEPLALSLPSEPFVAWKQEFQLTQHRPVFFSSHFVFVSLLAIGQLGVDEAWQPPAHTLLCFSFPLSSLPFSHSSVWYPLSCLLFCLIELFGRRACQTVLSMWGVWGAGGHPPLCSQRRVSFSPLLLVEWTWPRLRREEHGCHLGILSTFFVTCLVLTWCRENLFFCPQCWTHKFDQCIQTHVTTL